MSMTRIFTSSMHFSLMVILSGLVIYITYRVFIKANPDFNMEKSIANGNIAVGILVSMILYCASSILMAGADSSIQMMRMHMLAPTDNGPSGFHIIGIVIAHLTASMILAVFAISVTLRLFGRLTRKVLHAGKELEKGNIAVGLLLASVVFISSMYVKDGVAALLKSLSPQPSIGVIEIQE